MCEWMFNGIGTAVFSLASGAVIGGFTGCIICCRKYGIQIQRSGNESKQHQRMRFGTEKLNGAGRADSSAILQSQKSGADSAQIQIGGIRDEGY